MVSLEQKKWKEFFIDELFNIYPGKRLTKNDQKPGNIPYVSASAINNGITNFISNINPSLDKDVLGVIYEGEGGVAYSFYHKYQAIFSDTVKRFHFKEIPDNKYVYLFFSSIILKQRVKYNYGYSFNENRMKRQIILVPVDEEENPDYKYMEEYMKYEYRKRKELIKKQIQNKLSKISYKKIESFDNMVWKEFKVKDLFLEIEKCKCNNVSKLKMGKTPYVGATNRNNGVIKFVEADEKLITKGNCIVFICDGQGSIGYSIYRKSDFVGSTTLKVGRNVKINEFNAQFIVSALDKNRKIYSFGFKRKEERLRNEIILLPSDCYGNPDYDYMEQYIKNRMIRTYNKYIEFLED